RCLSNNPRETPAQVTEALARAGIGFEPDEILTAGALLTDYLAERYQGKRVLVIETEPVFSKILAARGVRVDGDGDAEAVVIGLGRRDAAEPPSAEAINRAVDIVRGGAPLVAASLDLLAPRGPRQFIPASGSVIAAIERLSGVQATLVGKPSESA